ncbi:hypothetical protein D3C86_1963360 [compost metagenome]
MNMQVMPSVLRRVSSITWRLSRRLTRAVRVAAAAPTAELSTRLVMPIRNRPVMEKKMNSGAIPALSRRSFSPRVICRRSSSGRAGPSAGFKRQRMTI